MTSPKLVMTSTRIAGFPLVRMLLLAVLAVLMLCSCPVKSVMPPGHVPRTGIVCQNAPLFMNCPPGHVIRIRHASYGRFSLSVCNENGVTEGWELNCWAKSSKDTVAQSCDGQPSCNISMTNDVFGDPCPGTYKYGEVKYVCQPASENNFMRVLSANESMTDTSTNPINNPRPVRGPPLAPVIRDVMAISPTEITVIWTQPESPNPVISTQVYLKVHGDVYEPRKHYATGTRAGVLTIQKLRPSTRYDIAIQSFNMQGNSPMSNIVSVSTPPGDHFTGPGVRASCGVGEFRCGSGECISESKLCDSERDCQDLSDETDCPCPGGAYKCASGRCVPIWRVCDGLPDCEDGSDETNCDGVRASCEVGEFHCGSGECISESKLCDSERDCQDLSDERDCPCPSEHYLCASGRCVPLSLVCDDYPHCEDGDDETNCDVETDPSTTTIPTTIPEDSTPKPSTTTPTTQLSTNTTTTSPSTTSTTTSSGGGEEEEVVPINSYCVSRAHRGVRWPRTRYGRIAEAECPNGLRGMATWRCLSEGWERSGPDYSNCVSQWMDQLDRQIDNQLLNSEQVEEVVEELSAAVREQDLNSGDLKHLAKKLLPRLGEGMMRDISGLPEPERRKLVKKFQKALMNTTSGLLSKRHMESWNELSRDDRTSSATSLMLAVEDAGFHSAALMEPGTRDTTVDTNIVLEVAVIDTGSSRSDTTFPQDLRQNQDWSNISDTITITSNSLRRAGADGRVSLVFSLYKNLEELIQPAEDLTSNPSSHYPNTATIHDTEVKVKATEMVVNTKVIAASIGSSKRSHELAEPVRFTLHHLQPSHGAVPVCAFWDVNYSTKKARWSREGCRMLDTNSSHTTCECDHLTNFAVLMDISGTELTRQAELGLIWITYIGCTISLVCLLLSFITFCVFKNLQCDRNTIHKNLVLTLLLAELVFLAGITQTDHQILCAVIAGVLHFLFLCAFAWMCLEGIQLYVMLVEVFEQEKSRVKWYYLLGYGIPLVIVAISAGVNHQGYGTDTYCWLTTENHFIWSFVGPALAVMLVNMGMLSVAIYIMCRHSNTSATVKERSTAAKVRAWLKGAVVLMVLLGLTWLLGLLYINAHLVVMAYCFTIVNSLQGLFIFVFHCLMNDKVQKEYRKVARRTAWLPDCIRVNYGGYSGASSTPNGSSGSGHYFSRLFKPKRKQSATSATNSSAKPFINKYHRRQSDTDHSRDSSTVPSSLNGYIYNPSFRPPSATTPFLLTTNNNGVTKTEPNGKSDSNYETVDEGLVEGLVGNLSELEYIDCSIVDSEMVTQYCQENLQVSAENKRYSTTSDESDVTTLKVHDPMDRDNLSNLSLKSGCNDRGEYSLANSIEPMNSGASGRDEKPTLDLQQYIIPVKRRGEQSNGPRTSSSSDQDPTNDPRSSSLNYLTSDPNQMGSEVTPQHNSTPNLQFRPAGQRAYHSYPAPPSPAQMDYSSQPAPPSTVPELRSPSSTKSSLPDLTLGGLTLNIDEETRRHSSNMDQFSPFRFSTTEC